MRAINSRPVGPTLARGSLSRLLPFACPFRYCANANRSIAPLSHTPFSITTASHNRLSHKDPPPLRPRGPLKIGIFHSSSFLASAQAVALTLRQHIIENHACCVNPPPPPEIAIPNLGSTLPVNLTSHLKVPVHAEESRHQVRRSLVNAWR